MADDGMFLNFAVDENFKPAVQKFKGGSWKDRLKAKRFAQRGGPTRRDNDPNSVPVQQRRLESRGSGLNGQLEDLVDSRPAKRRRENGSVPHSGEGLGYTRPPGQNHRRNEQKAAPGSREVISSLFTYNPKPTTAVEEGKDDDREEKPTTPSNAPLIDGIDTFTSLGLSPTVAAHLLTKMHLENPTAIQKAAISQMLKDDSDAFIQSETGSGKTLAYLLPLVQRIMTMSESRKETARDSTLHRDSGLFAIILAPTRELCKQISVVLERLLGCAHYIVAGTVIGGEKKKSEKARLRKGINILVATPGRLVDHLSNTRALDVSSVRWLVLDEGDRLMDLGFEEDITKIVTTLDLRKSRGVRAGLPEKRTTVLCSATLKMNVQKLGEISLKDAVLIKGDPGTTRDDEEADMTNGDGVADSAFLAPAQLKQSYLIVAAKLRLVTLTALLKRTFARKGSVMKAIVFISCADSVEFHFKAYTSALEGEEENGHKDIDENDPATDSDSELETPKQANPQSSAGSPSSDSISPSSILSSSTNKVTLYKLHGSLPQATRTNIVKHFASASAPSLLLATDVASRGLDLPNLDLVIEYDPAFSADDHLHRIGRTARLGRDGRAIVFLLPGKEEGYVDVLRRSYRKSDEYTGTGNVTRMDAEDVLKKGFSPQSGIIGTAKSAQKSEHPVPQTWSSAAESLQLALERNILAHPALKDLAKRAFQSHIRAYATHTASERTYFDIKELHLGHVAKSFGLRDAPGGVGRGGTGSGRGGKKRRGDGTEGLDLDKRPTGGDGGGDVDEAARKMRAKVNLSRKVMMGGGGADEFNIA